MVGWLGAAQDRLPADVPGTRRGCPGVPRRPVQGCRDAGTPARERGAAPQHRPGAIRAGRPGVVRRAGAAPSPQALDRNLSRGARDAAGLAPQAGRDYVRHEQAAQARSSADGREHRPPCRSAGEGESAVGIPPDPRRTDQARPRRRAVHSEGNHACRRHRSGSRAGRARPGGARATVIRRLCTIAGFYRYADEEELLDHSPTIHVRRPRLDYESHATGLDRNANSAHCWSPLGSGRPPSMR